MHSTWRTRRTCTSPRGRRGPFARLVPCGSFRLIARSRNTPRRCGRWSHCLSSPRTIRTAAAGAWAAAADEDRRSMGGVRGLGTTGRDERWRPKKRIHGTIFSAVRESLQDRLSHNQPFRNYPQSSPRSANGFAGPFALPPPAPLGLAPPLAAFTNHPLPPPAAAAGFFFAAAGLAAAGVNSTSLHSSSNQPLSSPSRSAMRFSMFGFFASFARSSPFRSPPLFSIFSSAASSFRRSLSSFSLAIV
mmetsp:Transcript_7728/g.31341  ORF Transcript_7728/g.31341 Transcript_7728/m.31341 type:complete len:246 (+) Transcript_7728:3313-4050(+)